MLAHFLRRDFVTYRVFWIVLLVASALAVPYLNAVDDPDRPMFVLSYMYFFFAVSPLAGLIGVTWRSQHVMSRNYLLSLPVPRKRLFAWLQVRAGVFWLPYLLLCFVAPFLSHSVWRFLIYLRLEYVEFLMASVLGVFWLVNTGITMQLMTERITGYLDLRLRFAAWIILIGSYVLEVLLLFLPLVLGRRWGWGPWPYLGCLGVLGWAHFFIARRLWLGR
ncbi:MAG: hypothetical protein IT285_08710 [Bdellovibrionales bacterium]|nr:hypothetical protein [Bdellovibrionales bacterium]